MAIKPEIGEADILKLLGSTEYQPLNKTDLAKKLGVPTDGRAQFRRILVGLEAKGKIVRIRKDRYVLPIEADLLIGTLQVNPQGFGYVLNATDDGRGDLFISAENIGTAMHGDRVVARIVREGLPISKRQRASREGRIIKILERANKTIVGTLQRSKNFSYVVPDEPGLVHDIYVRVAPDRELPPVNYKVVVRLDAWEHRHINPEGEIVEVLGPAQKPGVDILSIIRKYSLPTDFPEAVLSQANTIPGEIPLREIATREDMRSLSVFTIDPEDARDFDDAIHVKRVGTDWEVGIHIADVAHYIPTGSALDKEALRRGNSVYFPDRVLPMLPERLSNGICSLRPGEDHLTKSVIVHFDRFFKLNHYRFAASIIRSQARFTYQQVFKILQAPPRDAIGSQLHDAWSIASSIRKKRFKDGALELDMPEARVKVDHEGKVIGLVREENDISHQMIEEFMLLANNLVAKELRERAIPAVYRVHEDPDSQKLLEFRELVKSHGIAVGDLSQRREMKAFLARLTGKAEEDVLKVGLLRSLRKAVYAPEPIGHYGLAKADYTHFTSPIRRYSDLIVHRAFTFGLLREKGKLPRSVDLPSICEHISKTERIAADAEREAVRLKKLEYFSGLIGKPHRFTGTVVDVRNYGLMVEVKEAIITGLIHISSLDDDFFIFDPANQRIFGRKTKVTFKVGDIVEVRVVRTDLFKHQIDFELAA